MNIKVRAIALIGVVFMVVALFPLLSCSSTSNNASSSQVNPLDERRALIQEVQVGMNKDRVLSIMKTPPDDRQTHMFPNGVVGEMLSWKMRKEEGSIWNYRVGEVYICNKVVVQVRTYEADGVHTITWEDRSADHVEERRNR